MIFFLIFERQNVIQIYTPKCTTLHHFKIIFSGEHICPRTPLAAQFPNLKKNVAPCQILATPLPPSPMIWHEGITCLPSQGKNNPQERNTSTPFSHYRKNLNPLKNLNFPEKNNPSKTLISYWKNFYPPPPQKKKIQFPWKYIKPQDNHSGNNHSGKIWATIYKYLKPPGKKFPWRKLQPPLLIKFHPLAKYIHPSGHTLVPLKNYSPTKTYVTSPSPPPAMHMSQQHDFSSV